MKTKIIGIALFGLTAATVAYYPAAGTFGSGIQQPPPEVSLPIIPDRRPKVEVVFVLDTTSSMSGMIEAAKEKIWSIASTMASAQPTPEIHIGLVAFRDRGDAYVTKVVDLSTDLDSLYSTLIDFRAEGGGDGPESVNQALYDAVHRISWSQDPDTYKVMFLVGDSPPHMDYADDVPYPQSMAAAREKGIVVNTIQCGQHPETRSRWLQIASGAEGQYFDVAQAGSAIAIATPYDADLARLSAELDETRLFYGSAEEQRKHAAKTEATAKLHALASKESRARRATFNASEAGHVNLLGDRDLVDAVAEGRVDLGDMEKEELPASLQPLSPAELKDAVADTAKKRDLLKIQIRELSDRRESYLQEQLESAGGAEDSLDFKLHRTIREQGARSGLSYEEAPKL